MSYTTTVRLTDELNERLRTAMARRKVRTLQAMFDEALEVWIRGEQAKPNAPAIPEGYEQIILRREAVPLVQALIQWIETEGKEKVLDTLDRGLASVAPDQPLDSKHERAGISRKDRQISGAKA